MNLFMQFQLLLLFTQYYRPLNISFFHFVIIIIILLDGNFNKCS